MLSFVPDVAEGAVEDEVNAPPSVLKAYLLSQLSVQYLLQTQELCAKAAGKMMPSARRHILLAK